MLCNCIFKTKTPVFIFSISFPQQASRLQGEVCLFWAELPHQVNTLKPPHQFRFSVVKPQPFLGFRFFRIRVMNWALVKKQSQYKHKKDIKCFFSRKKKIINKTSEEKLLAAACIVFSHNFKDRNSFLLPFEQIFAYFVIRFVSR